MDWRLLQLADAAFPTGGFAHSGGLEAALALGEVPDVGAFVEAALWQAGQGALPLVRAAHAEPARAAELDALCEAFLSGQVARRASRTQGRAFLATAAQSFAEPALAALDQAVRARALHGHLPVVFGAVTRALGLGADDAAALHLHLVLRGVLSAAVRLGCLGPHEAQRRQADLAPLLERVLADTAGLGPADLAHTAPLSELWGTLHDSLYSRMFQS